MEVSIIPQPNGAEQAHLVESAFHRALTAEEVKKLIEEGALAVDLRRPAEFAGAHIPGALNIILDDDFAHCASALLQPSLPIVLVADDVDDINRAATRLAHLGIADVKGFLGGGVYAWQQAELPIETLRQLSAAELYDRIKQNHLQIVDVRQAADYSRGHLRGAINIPISDLETNLSKLDSKRQLILICVEGNRSSTAASMLLRRGFHELSSVAGGMSAWLDAGFVVEESSGRM